MDIASSRHRFSKEKDILKSFKNKTYLRENQTFFLDDRHMDSHKILFFWFWDFFRNLRLEDVEEFLNYSLNLLEVTESPLLIYYSGYGRISEHCPHESQIICTDGKIFEMKSILSKVLDHIRVFFFMIRGFFPKTLMWSKTLCKINFFIPRYKKRTDWEVLTQQVFYLILALGTSFCSVFALKKIRSIYDKLLSI